MSLLSSAAVVYWLSLLRYIETSSFVQGMLIRNSIVYVKTAGAQSA